MPNWCSNSLTVRGTRKNVLEFLNRGLKAVGVQAADLLDANRLINLYSSYNKDNPLRDMNRGREDSWSNGSVYKRKYVVTSFSLECYVPMPDTFHWVDTTNNFHSRHKEGTKAYNMEKEYYESEKKFQQEHYGVVGWYDWNRKNYGTKWNADIEFYGMTINDELDEVELYLGIDTAWSPCDEWLRTVQNDNRLVRFEMVSQEPGCVFRIVYTSCGYGDDVRSYAADEEVEIFEDDQTAEYECELADEMEDEDEE